MSDETAPQAENARGFRKVREGLVVSDKMDKTIVCIGRGPGQAPPLQQGHSSDQQGQGA